MKGKARILTVVAVLLVAAGVLAYWRLLSSGEAKCGYCSRPIRPEARAVAEINGERRETCCVRCVLTEARQTAGHAHVIEVTDFNSKRSLKPDQAWFVEGSHEIACDHDAHKQVDETKHSSEVHFDRCSPGAFAFVSAEAAQAFAAERGGVVRRLAEMEQERQP